MTMQSAVENTTPPTVHAQPAMALLSGLTAEMLRIRSSLENLSTMLVSDIDLVERHIDALQDFDLLIQQVDECRLMMERHACGESLDELFGKIRLDAMQIRLRPYCKNDSSADRSPKIPS